MQGRSFRDKTIVITGASAGIGLACARRFAADGARVVLAARGVADLEAAAAEIEAAGGQAIAVPGDVADLAAAAALIDRAVAETGAVHVLINNAGFNARGPIEDHDAATLARVVAVNLAAPIALCRLALPHLQRSRGAIVNVASLAGRLPLPNEAVYSATKFGLRAFSFAIADELAASGIRVAVVSPGPVETGFLLGALDEVPDVVLSQPLRTADEIAALVYASAADGKRERVPERLGGWLTTLGYLAPSLRRALTPLMERRGRRAKQRLRGG
jgi:hypothetical protein